MAQQSWVETNHTQCSNLHCNPHSELMIWERTRHSSTTTCSHPSSSHTIFCHTPSATRTHWALLADSLNLPWHTTGSLASLAKSLPFSGSVKYMKRLAPLHLIQAHKVNITLVMFRKTFGFKVDANSCLLCMLSYDDLIKVLKPSNADVPLWSLLLLPVVSYHIHCLCRNFFDFAPLLCDWFYSSVFHTCICSYYLFLQQL